MANKNRYIEERDAMRRAFFDAGLQCGRQQILDMVSIVLRDPDIMGKDTFGKDRLQMVVALEELSEAQKELCKFMRGNGDIEHTAEEIADAAIMLEQMCMVFGINERVNYWIDKKVQRLADRLKGGAGECTDGEQNAAIRK